jgi:hemerythrin superfamily protein
MLDAEPDDVEVFTAPIRELIQIVTSHVKEEETELFPKVLSIVDADRLLEMGVRMGELADTLADEDDVTERLYDETDRPAQL